MCVCAVSVSLSLLNVFSFGIVDDFIKFLSLLHCWWDFPYWSNSMIDLRKENSVVASTKTAASGCCWLECLANEKLKNFLVTDLTYGFAHWILVTLQANKPYGYWCPGSPIWLLHLIFRYNGCIFIPFMQKIENIYFNKTRADNIEKFLLL